jgi:hypothetical protein
MRAHLLEPPFTMTRLQRLLLVAALSALLGGCVVAPYPYGAPVVTPAAPASFDRSWDAALGAAADAGVQVTSADRSSGRISGSKGGAAVTIELRPQPDGSLQVRFNAPDSRETNPTLNERWLASYQRRMGR